MFVTDRVNGRAAEGVCRCVPRKWRKTVPMRKLLTIVLALTVLAACDSESPEPRASMATTTTARARPAKRPTTTTSTTSTTTTTSTTIPAPAATTLPLLPSGDEHSGCSEGRLDAATMQRSVDEGHQPW